MSYGYLCERCSEIHTEDKEDTVCKCGGMITHRALSGEMKMLNLPILSTDNNTGREPRVLAKEESAYRKRHVSRNYPNRKKDENTYVLES